MRGVRKRFGAVRALDGVDLEVRAGEVHALIGENGAGKSTLMKVLSGAHRADDGALELADSQRRLRPYRPRSPRDARGAGVAMIYQELTLAPHLSVQANIMLGRESARFGVRLDRQDAEMVTKALERIGHSDIHRHRLVSTLSSAEQQLVEIARALASDARIIVLDEPTSSLSLSDVARLSEVLHRLRDDGVALIYISHFLEQVKDVADRYTVLRDGTTVRTGEMASATLDDLIEAMAGRTVEQAFPHRERARGSVALELEPLATTSRDPSVARAPKLVIRRGEVLGIAGLVGSGRTELLRSIFGLAAVRSGKVTVVGAREVGVSPYARIRNGMGFLSEDRKNEGLAASMSIAENLTLSRLKPHARRGWLSVASRDAATRRFADALSIRRRDIRQPVSTLSGGNQQKVAIARLLHQEADVLLLDEPTRGIDVRSKMEVYEWIDRLARDGKAILMVSSYSPELLGMCDRIAVMCRGDLGPARPASAWTEEEILAAASGAERNGGQRSDAQAKRHEETIR